MKVTSKLARIPGRDWFVVALSSAMVATAAIAAVPATAWADPVPPCDCAGTYCQDTYGSYYQRVCCRHGSCGCTIDVQC